MCNINNDEPCLPLEPFVKELKRVYKEKYKQDFSDFFVDALRFLDGLEAGYCNDIDCNTFKAQFYDFARFFLPLENLTRVMVNNLKTKETTEDYTGETVATPLLYKIPENKNNL